MYAVRQNAAEAVRGLAAAGADLNATDPDGTTALVLAVINAHYDLAAELVDLGADPNLGDSTGMTPLYAAVDMHTLPWIAARPAPKTTDDKTSIDIVKMLLAKDADVNARLRGRVLQKMHMGGDPSLV
jgi:ankyrin repeat protein